MSLATPGCDKASMSSSDTSEKASENDVVSERRERHREFFKRQAKQQAKSMLKNGLCVTLMLLLWMLALCWKVVGSLDDFEMDTSLSSVVCRQCIQLWRVVAKDSRSTCGPHARTCTGNACFMRQCKHCPIYQYMSGCLTLTEWQLSDLALSRQRAELLATRVGATLLCEDSANQTTCVCNRKDKCNDIHARAPFSTYSGNLFGGIINFDSAISKIDPRYGEMVRSKHAFQFYSSISSIISSTVLIWITVLLNILIQ